jgi:hypothetical protein
VSPGVFGIVNMGVSFHPPRLPIIIEYRIVSALIALAVFADLAVIFASLTIAEQRLDVGVLAPFAIFSFSTIIRTKHAIPLYFHAPSFALLSAWAVYL